MVYATRYQVQMQQDVKYMACAFLEHWFGMTNTDNVNTQIDQYTLINISWHLHHWRNKSLISKFYLIQQVYNAVYLKSVQLQKSHFWWVFLKSFQENMKNTDENGIVKHTPIDRYPYINNPSFFGQNLNPEI